MSTVNSALKQARDALVKKEYKECLKWCKEALSQDKTNYNAYVFVGKAAFGMNENTKAEAAYRKAIEIAKPNPLAWQGLAEVYEKSGETEKAVPVYSELLEILKSTTEASGGPKTREITRKLCTCHLAMENIDEALANLRALLAPPVAAEERAELLAMQCDILERRERTEIERKVSAATPAQKPAGSTTGVRVLSIGAKPAAPQLTPEEVRRNAENDAALDERSELELCYRELVTAEDCPLIVHESLLKRLFRRLTILTSNQQHEKAAKVRTEVIERVRSLVRSHSESSFVLSCALQLSEDDSNPLSLDQPQKDSIAARLVLLDPTCPQALVHLGLAWLRMAAAEKQTDSDSLARAERFSDGASELLARGVKSCPESATAWVGLARSLLQKGSFLKASECVVRANGVIEKQKGVSLKWAKRDLALIAAHCNARLHKREEAIAAFELVLKSDPKNKEAKKGLASVCLESGDVPRALSLFRECLEIDPSDHISAHSAAEALLQTALSGESAATARESMLLECVGILKAAIAARPNAANYHFTLAKVFWELAGEYRTSKQHCLASLVTSAKHDPYHAPTYTLLGQVFLTALNDAAQAKRCFAKAVSLDPLQSLAGELLIKMYRDAGQVTLAIQACTDAVAKSVRAKWAWKCLGFHHLAQKRLDESVLAFQGALRVDPSDPTAWEGLGLAYCSQGKIFAALKSLQRSAELNPGRVSTLYEIARLRNLLSENKESERVFRELLKIDEKFLPGYMGLAQVLFGEARKFWQDGLLVNAAECLNKTIEVCSEGLRQITQTPSAPFAFLKLFSDVLLFGGSRFSTEILTAGSGGGVLSTARSVLERALETSKSVSKDNLNENHEHTIWHDMALCAFYECKQSDDPSVVEKAIEYAKKAIALRPAKASYWDTLGVIHTDPAVQQHSFIRAIQLKPKVSRSWDNLCTFYMTQNSPSLARHALLTAQSLDPSSHVAWSCVGLLNERCVGQQNGALAKAKAAYQHATTLAVHPLSLQGFAHSSMCTSDIDSARIALLRFLQLKPKDSWALNALALCHERSGCMDRALEALDRISGDTTDVASCSVHAASELPPLLSTSTQSQTSSSLTAVLANRARISARLPSALPKSRLQSLCGQLEPCQDAQTKRALSALYFVLGEVSKYAECVGGDAVAKALGLVACGQFEQSISIIESAQPQAGNDALSHRCAHLAIHALSPSATKDSVETSAKALQAELKQGAETLTPECLEKAYRLIVLAFTKKGDHDSAISTATHFAHAHPNVPPAWDLFATSLLNVLKPKFHTTEKFVGPQDLSLVCAQLMELPNLATPTTTSVFDRNLIVASLYYHMGKAPSFENAKSCLKNAISFAQKCVLWNPSCLEGRALLGHASRALLILERKGAVGMQDAVPSVAETARAQWNAGNHDAAFDTLSGALSETPNDISLIKLLSELLMQSGRFASASKFLSSAVNTLQHSGAQKNDVHSCLVWLARSHLHCNQADQALVAADAALVINEHSASAHFLKGLGLHMLGKLSEAKLSLRQAVTLDSTLPVVQHVLYLCHYALEEWDQAEQCLMEQKAQHPERPQIWVEMAKFALESGAPEPALQFITEALKLDPVNARAQDMQAQISAALGQA